jgi:hypothetical protein
VIATLRISTRLSHRRSAQTGLIPLNMKACSTQIKWSPRELILAMLSWNWIQETTHFLNRMTILLSFTNYTNFMLLLFNINLEHSQFHCWPLRKDVNRSIWGHHGHSTQKLKCLLFYEKPVFLIWCTSQEKSQCAGLWWLHLTEYKQVVESPPPDSRQITDIFSFRRSRPLYGFFKGGVGQMKL